MFNNKPVGKSEAEGYKTMASTPGFVNSGIQKQPRQKGGNSARNPIVFKDENYSSAGKSSQVSKHRRSHPISSNGEIDDISEGEKEEFKNQIRQVYTDSSDEDYEEEIKGKSLKLTQSFTDTVPSPDKVEILFGQNRKEYLEEESLEAFQKAGNENEILHESSEFIDNDKNSPNHKYPILFVDVNLGEERVERLTVLEGDTSHEVAHNFWIKHNLNEKMEEKLEQMLDEQMNGILTRINEEREQSPDFSNE